MNKVIMISGKQGSGKTSTQKLLGERLQACGANVEYVNFADILYEMHNAVLDVLHYYWPKRDIVKDGPLLQMLGTNWGRKTIDENIWVKCLESKINYFPKDRIVIVGDCRFPNEFDGFPEALRVRLECSEEIRKARCSMWRENTAHPSEVELDQYAQEGKFDLTIDTGLTSLEECVDLIQSQLIKNKWIEPLTNSAIIKAQKAFEQIADDFSFSLRAVEKDTGYGANFHWHYDTEGKKCLKVTDIGKSTIPSESKIAWAKDTIPDILERATKELVKNDLTGP